MSQLTLIAGNLPDRKYNNPNQSQHPQSFSNDADQIQHKRNHHNDHIKAIKDVKEVTKVRGEWFHEDF